MNLFFLNESSPQICPYIDMHRSSLRSLGRRRRRSKCEHPRGKRPKKGHLRTIQSCVSSHPLVHSRSSICPSTDENRTRFACLLMALLFSPIIIRGGGDRKRSDTCLKGGGVRYGQKKRHVACRFGDLPQTNVVSSSARCFASVIS